MRDTYVVKQDCIIRGRRYKCGEPYHPETQEDIQMLLSLHMIRRTHPPNDGNKGGKRYGRYRRV